MIFFSYHQHYKLSFFKSDVRICFRSTVSSIDEQ